MRLSDTNVDSAYPRFIGHKHSEIAEIIGPDA